MAVIIVLAVGGVAAAAEPLFEGAPPVPKGYSDYRLVEEAVKKGEVKEVTLPTGAPEGVAFYDNVPFWTPDGKSLSLDLYVPMNAPAPPPVVLFIHGGAWRAGKKEHTSFFTTACAKLGYAAASVQYRLAPKHKFPKAIHDVNCAMAWLKFNGDAFGFDGSRMVLGGDSAGGHLALLAGYGQDSRLRCPCLTDDAAPDVKGILNLYGVVDCTTPVAQGAPQVIDFIGKPYSEAPEMYALASPILHLDANDPPTVTFHGIIDELVPISQADRLHKRLNELGIPNYYDRLEGWPHGLDTIQPLCERFSFIIGRFLEKHMPLKP